MGRGQVEIAGTRHNGSLWLLRGETFFPALRSDPDDALELVTDDADPTWYPMDGARDVSGDGLEDTILVQWTGMDDPALWAWGLYTGWAIPWDEVEWW